MVIEFLNYPHFLQFCDSYADQLRQIYGEETEQVWEKTWAKFVKMLKRIGKISPAVRDDIDGSVGDDWYGDRCLHFALRSDKFLRPEVIKSIVLFLKENPAYTVMLGASPGSRPDWRIFVTNTEIKAAIYKKSAEESRAFFFTDPVLSAFIFHDV